VNEEEFDSLRRWGEALADDPRDEVRAAGRAIHLLAEEVERLQVELWHAKIGVNPPPKDGTEPAEADDETLVPHADGDLETELQSTFSRVAKRLHAPRVFRRGPTPS